MGNRILFDSRNSYYKTPFGALKAKEFCSMKVEIPFSCPADKVVLCLRQDGNDGVREIPFAHGENRENYAVWSGRFSPEEPGLYYYCFRISTANETFRLLRLGAGDTNMEAGNLWQITCTAATYAVPRWAEGAVMYQIMPDRFYKGKDHDLSQKLQPFWLHEKTEELPQWQPDEKGEVLNHDFFGGDLAGIREKLPYLQSLGVEVLYLNPIFMAYSNHRYDTCDYMRIDPMLGTEEDLQSLCKDAHALGIHVILDGVFSHTGSRSVYFDRNNEFGGGAFHNPQSPYRSWYRFKDREGEYESWWGFKTLPCLDKNNPSYRGYIYGDENSVIKKWLSLGVDGFRLDVADELPDDFILGLRQTMRRIAPDSLLLGEVWEDASDKIAYGVRRRYFADCELDGVMNYPWRSAILRFCRGEDSGENLCRQIELLLENYPAPVLNCSMTLLSSHDVARALTELAAPFEGTREAMAQHWLTPEQKAIGLQRLRMAAVLQYALPGMPCIYYGDEAEAEGCKDPFNRRFYPWGRENVRLQQFYRFLGNLRKNSAPLRRGTTCIQNPEPGIVSILRACQREKTEITVDVRQCRWYIDGTEQKL